MVTRHTDAYLELWLSGTTEEEREYLLPRIKNTIGYKRAELADQLDIVLEATGFPRWLLRVMGWLLRVKQLGKPS